NFSRVALQLSARERGQRPDPTNCAPVRVATKVYGWVIGAIGLVITVVPVASEDFRHAIRDFWPWAYPGPLVMALGVAVVCLTGALYVATRRPASAVAKAH